MSDNEHRRCREPIPRVEHSRRTKWRIQAPEKKTEADSIFNALDNMMNYNIHIEDKNRTRHTNPKTENKYPDKRTNENGKSTNRKPTFYMFIFRVLKNITW